MSLLPHFGEIFLLAVVVLIVFGVGKLPQLSEAIARRSLPKEDTAPKDQP